MYIKLKGKKIIVRELTKFKDRFISYKFKLEPIKEGLCFPKKRWFSTYLYCQRVDVIMTDKDNKILYMYQNLKSEKIIFFKKSVYYTYIFPSNTANDLKVGDKLKINKN